MEWEVCAHKVARDHIVSGAVGEKGETVWRCSKCGAEDLWGPGWRYYGNVECKRCMQAAIDRVECAACALTAAEGRRRRRG